MFSIFTNWWKGLHDVTVVDKACVWQQWGAAEARQGSPLSSQQHQVTGWHLWEISEATSNTYKPQRDRNRRVTYMIVTVMNQTFTSYFTCTSHPWFWLLLMLQQWWRDLGRWMTSSTPHIRISCVWTGSTPEPCHKPPPVASVLLHLAWN